MCQHQQRTAQTDDEGAEGNQRLHLIEQIDYVIAEHRVVDDSPAQQGSGNGDGENGRQPDSQGQSTAAQAAFGQPANHRPDQQALQQSADNHPDEQRAQHHADELHTVVRCHRVIEHLAHVHQKPVQASQVVIGRANQRGPECRTERARRARADLRIEEAAAQVEYLRGQIPG